MPETKHFQSMQHRRNCIAQEGEESHRIYHGDSTRRMRTMAAFYRESSAAVKNNWALLIYMVVLMTAFNSCSHGSQDFFPTFLKSQVNLSPTQVVVVSVVGQLGSITGGTVLGYISTFSGRRLIMLTACVFGGALVPAYITPRSMILICTTFFEQVFVGGVWGPVPVYLMELSPSTLTTTVVGLSYQLGNLASSGSATIQAKVGESYRLPPGSDGMERFDYGKVIAIFMGAVWGALFMLLLIGPEMTQSERDEEAEAVGQRTALKLDKVVSSGPAESIDKSAE